MISMVGTEQQQDQNTEAVKPVSVPVVASVLSTDQLTAPFTANIKLEDDDALVATVDDSRLKVPHRRCIVTGATLNKDQLLRFVVGPDNSIVADIDGNLPGRGIWISADSEALERAISRRLFARAARKAVTVPADLSAQLCTQLHRRLIEGLSLARRAGQAIAGYDKVREALKSGDFVMLVEACDAGSDSGKMRALARAVSNGTLPVVAPLDGASLGRAFGRDRAVHVGLRSGKLARRILRDATRLAGLQSGASGTGDTKKNGLCEMQQPQGNALTVNDHQPSEVDD